MHKLIRFARREQGLIVAPGNPLRLASLEDLGKPGVRFANRAPGSGTRLISDELLARTGVPVRELAGYDSAEPTHLSVAANVAAGIANCGFGLRAAADCFGLDFVPIAHEQYFLVCLKPARETAAMGAVLDVMAGEDFRRFARAAPGYDADAAGELVALRRTLPWYK